MCKKLDEYLAVNGITNEEFGNDIGVSGASVSRYRNGERTPEAEVMPRIISATNGWVMPNNFYPELAILTQSRNSSSKINSKAKRGSKS